jgi:hypothetical protein
MTKIRIFALQSHCEMSRVPCQSVCKPLQWSSCAPCQVSHHWSLLCDTKFARSAWSTHASAGTSMCHVAACCCFLQATHWHVVLSHIALLLVLAAQVAHPPPAAAAPHHPCGMGCRRCRGRVLQAVIARREAGRHLVATNHQATPTRTGAWSRLPTQGIEPPAAPRARWTSRPQLHHHQPQKRPATGQNSSNAPAPSWWTPMCR